MNDGGQMSNHAAGTGGLPLSAVTNSAVLAATMLLLLFAPPVSAENEAAIAHCATVTDADDRIACLESALRGESAESPEIVPAEEPSPAPNIETPPSQPPAPAPSRPAAEARPPVANPKGAPVPEDFGLKEKKPPPKNDAVQVTVTAVTTNLLGKLVFETDNGQVWLQVDQRVVKLDDAPFTAEIRPATMGSFFLRPDDRGVSIRVRREQ